MSKGRYRSSKEKGARTLMALMVLGCLSVAVQADILELDEADFSQPAFGVDVTRSYHGDVVRWTVDFSNIEGHWSTGLQLIIANAEHPLFLVGWSPGESTAHPVVKTWDGSWQPAQTALPEGFSVSGAYNDEHFVIEVPVSGLMASAGLFYWALNAEASWPGHSSSVQQHFPADWTRWTGMGCYADELPASESGTALTHFPPYTLWMAADDEAALYTLNSQAPEAGMRMEGVITGLTEQADIEALTISEQGTIYMMNNSGRSRLYRVDAASIDGRPETPVNAVLIGNTGLSAGNSNEEITGMQCVSGVLYGISKKTRKLWRINTGNAAISLVAHLDVKGSLRSDGMTLGADGVVYLLKTRNSDSELWRFSTFPDGTLEKVLTISGSGKVEALTAHPDGTLLAADDTHCWQLFPAEQRVEMLTTWEADVEGMDYFYAGEAAYLADPDDDNDGMPDAWENENGMNPLDASDAGADADGDGMSNYAECRAGTNPHSQASVFRINIDVVRQRGRACGAKLNWPAAPRRTYAILRAENVEGPYRKIQGGIPAADEVNLYEDFAVQEGCSYYYRVEIEPNAL